MRYKSIELINYAGIYNGMGLTQISIDFTQCVSNKIIIRGSNGSGKSTIISSIHPNPDSNDKFIPGAEARKTLVLTDNGIDYIIRYIHPVTNSGRGTTRGYISKLIDGQMVELNPNGNVSSCKDIINDEFNFDSAYSSLSQLSSEDRGLVDKKPAERKKLVNNITNSLDTYNSIYKAVSKKAATLKGLISNISNKIDMIGPGSKIAASLVNLENRIKTLEDEKTTTIEAIAGIKLKISELQDSLDKNQYNEIVTDIAMTGKLLKSLEGYISSTLQNYNIESIDGVKSFLEALNHDIIVYNSEIARKKQEIQNALRDREVDFNALQDKQHKLNSLQGEHNYLELKESLSKLEQELLEYESMFSKAGLMNIDFITKDEYNSAMESLYYLRDMVNGLYTNYYDEFVASYINHRSTYDEAISKLPSTKEKIHNLEQQILQLKTQISIAEAQRANLAALDKRPAECKIDTCPYINAAIEAASLWPDDKYNALLQQLDQLEEELEHDQVYYDYTTDIQNISIKIAAIERELKSRYILIKKLPVRSDFAESFLSRIAKFDPFSDIDELYKYVDYGNIIEQYKVCKEQYKIYKSEFDIYKTKNDIIDSIISDIETIQSSLDRLSLQIEQDNHDIDNLSKSLTDSENVKSKLESLLDKYNIEYAPNKSKYDDLVNTKNTLDIAVNQIQVYREQLDHLNKNMGAINSDINNLSQQRDACRHSLIMLQEYNDEIDKYHKEYVMIDKIKYYASPNTGIQSIFIGLYMNKILSLANELLAMLFGGEFVLQPFIVNESEFRIPCIGDSNIMHDDISSMSTAQKSTISMIISFALLHQSSTKYNIICLDEIDSALDTSNRSGFVGLLDKLMSLLNCEQAFIISHNAEFDTSACDMVCLKNTSSELMNGHIIWKL